MDVLGSMRAITGDFSTDFEVAGIACSGREAVDQRVCTSGDVIFSVIADALIAIVRGEGRGE
jgi:hypothetical protein